MKTDNYDALPAKIGKITVKIRYQLSLINNIPIVLKFTEHIQMSIPNMITFAKNMNSIDLPAKIGKRHQQNPVLAITN